MAEAQNAEIALVQHLKKNYKGPTFLRPVKNAADAVEVTIGYSLETLSLDQHGGMVTISGYVYRSWNDHNLTWDPAQFGNIRWIRVPTSEIWTPDVGASACVVEEVRPALAAIGSDGTVLHIPSTVHKIQGRRTATGYRASLRQGSWTFDSTQVALKLLRTSGIKLDDFVQGDLWNVSAGGVEITTKEYEFDGMKESYPTANFHIDIQQAV